MNEYEVQRMALVLAVQAEIEGMKACNQYQAVLNDFPLYNQKDFNDMAAQLRDLAYSHNHKL